MAFRCLVSLSGLSRLGPRCGASYPGRDVDTARSSQSYLGLVKRASSRSGRIACGVTIIKSCERRSLSVRVRNGFHRAACVGASCRARQRRRVRIAHGLGVEAPTRAWSIKDASTLGRLLGVARCGWTSNRFFCGLLKLCVWQSVRFRPEGTTRRTPHSEGNHDRASLSSPQCSASQLLRHPQSLLTLVLLRFFRLPALVFVAHDPMARLAPVPSIRGPIRARPEYLWRMILSCIYMGLY